MYIDAKQFCAVWINCAEAGDEGGESPVATPGDTCCKSKRTWCEGAVGACQIGEGRKRGWWTEGIAKERAVCPGIECEDRGGRKEGRCLLSDGSGDVGQGNIQRLPLELAMRPTMGWGVRARTVRLRESVSWRTWA